MNARPDQETVLQQLKQLIDPEVGINVVDLGLVEKINIQEGGHVDLIMLVTTPGCPLQDILSNGAKRLLEDIPGVTSVEVTIAHTPRWTAERMNPEIMKMRGGEELES